MTVTTDRSKQAHEADRAITRQIPRSLAILGVILIAFCWWSAHSHFAKQGLGAGRPPGPPVYGRFLPHFSAFGALAVAVGVGAVVFALRAMARAGGRRAGAFLAATVMIALAFSASVVMIDNKVSKFASPLTRNLPPDYHADTRFVDAYGFRGFVERYPQLVPEITSIHSLTHPAGPVVVVAALEAAFPGAPGASAVVLALLGLAVVVPTYLIARRLLSERAARVAVLLLAFAPAPIMFSFTSLDALFATVLATCVYLLIRGLERDASWRRAAVAGVAVGLAAFLTYAVSFLAMFGALYAFRNHAWRRALRLLLITAAGGLGGLAFWRLAIGFDLFAAYRAGYAQLDRFPSSRLQLYWIFGNVATWLLFAGLPIAALGLRELWRKRPWYLMAMLIPLVGFYALPDAVTHIIPGETERTLQFVYPLAATATAAFFLRWERARGAPSDRWVAALVAIAALQTIAIEALYDIPW